MEQKRGLESFFLEGDKNKAVLLVHGYTGTTCEMRPLGNYLHDLGYTVYCPCLPGHGTCVEDLERTTASDWYAEAERACDSLLAKYTEVYVAGLSMGGLLTLNLAANKPVKKAVAMAAPIFLLDKRIPFLPFLKYIIRYIHKGKREFKGMEAYNYTYDRMPTRPVGSLVRMMKKTRQSVIGRIKIPMLILQSKLDHTVNPMGAQYLYDHLNLPPEQKRLVWYEHCGHILVLDAEHEKVFQEVAKFFAEA